MEYRKRWRRSWDDVKYCGEACRRRKVGPVDRALEQTLVELLAGRPASANVCPSEAARAVAPHGWRDLVEPARRAARRLAAADRVVMRQGGRVIDPSAVRGPVRVGRGPAWTS